MTVATEALVPQPEPSPAPTDGLPRTWLRRIRPGGQIVESCPPWCSDSHLNDRTGCLEDLSHGASFDGPRLAVFDAEAGRLDMPVLSGRIQVDPYSTDPRRNVPHVNLEPWMDEFVEALDPDGFAAVIAELRAHCDRLEEIHARLVAARAECRLVGPAGADVPRRPDAG